MSIAIIEFNKESIMSELTELSIILADSVNSGASISFMSPFSYDAATAFWSGPVLDGIISGERILYGAKVAGKLVGTVQLITSMPPNQPHRSEVAKLIVHPDARRMGVARALMNHLINNSIKLGKTLITLDTTTGSDAETLYRSIGFEVAGIIPDYAFSPDNQRKAPTTYMYLLKK